uniref:Uncharacterized protein n=1 Tax=Ditylenchus dipsaci TaxID=166011 RepID=A0A915CN34_9BILA
MELEMARHAEEEDNKFGEPFENVQANHYSTCSNISENREQQGQLSRFVTDIACYSSRPNVNNGAGKDYTPLGLPAHQLPPAQSTDNNSSFSVVHNMMWDSEDAQTTKKRKMIVLSSSSSSSNSASTPLLLTKSGMMVKWMGVRLDTGMILKTKTADPRWSALICQFLASSQLLSFPYTLNKHQITVAKAFSSNSNRQDMCFGKAANVLPSWVNAQRQKDGAVLEKTQSDTIKSVVLQQQQELQQCNSCQATYEEVVECLLKGEKLVISKLISLKIF